MSADRLVNIYITNREDGAKVAVGARIDYSPNDADRAWVETQIGDVPHRNIAADRIIAALPENLTGYLAEKVASSAAELAGVRERLGVPVEDSPGVRLSDIAGIDYGRRWDELTVPVESLGRES